MAFVESLVVGGENKLQRKLGLLHRVWPGLLQKPPVGHCLRRKSVHEWMDGCIEDRGEDPWWVRDNNEELNRWLRYNRWIHVLRRWGVLYKSRLLINEKKKI